MASSPITQKYLKSILDYNPETGIFTWRERTPDMFNETQKRSREHACKNWNSRCSGKQAGWLKDGYIIIEVNGNKHRSHVLAYVYMNGKYPENEIDHDNGNSSDNRWINLRPATRSQNLMNTKIRKDNRSGFRGVSFSKASSKWQAQICVNNKRFHLGLFNTPQEAHEAYCAAALKYFGEFSRFK